MSLNSTLCKLSNAAILDLFDWGEEPYENSEDSPPLKPADLTAADADLVQALFGDSRFEDDEAPPASIVVSMASLPSEIVSTRLRDTITALLNALDLSSPAYISRSEEVFKICKLVVELATYAGWSDELVKNFFIDQIKKHGSSEDRRRFIQEVPKSIHKNATFVVRALEAIHSWQDWKLLYSYTRSIGQHKHVKTLVIPPWERLESALACDCAMCKSFDSFLTSDAKRMDLSGLPIAEEHVVQALQTLYAQPTVQLWQAGAEEAVAKPSWGRLLKTVDLVGLESATKDHNASPSSSAYYCKMLSDVVAKAAAI
jgi:hypothetical protein